MKINIGGGKHYAPGWVNLDRQNGVTLDEFTELPCPDGEADVIYSSHCFEHLDDATVAQLVAETHRVLAYNGVFVLKIPDFGQVLERWERRDEAWFDRHWGLASIIPTWASRSMPVDIHSKAGMIFCGWWNDVYGDEFGERHPEREGAYHGPAMPLNVVKAWTPHGIASEMREHVPQGAHFNHRNAWSRQQMRSLLFKHGLYEDRNARTMPQIPGIEDQWQISAYFICKKQLAR